MIGSPLLLGVAKENDFFECFGIGNDEVGKDFAVENNIFDFELIDEMGIFWSALDLGEAGFDALDPECAHVAFSEFAADIGVLAGVEVRFFAGAVETTFGHAHAFGALEHFFVTSSSGWSGFDSHGWLGISV